MIRSHAGVEPDRLAVAGCRLIGLTQHLKRLAKRQPTRAVIRCQADCLAVSRNCLPVFSLSRQSAAQVTTRLRFIGIELDRLAI